MNTLLLRLFVVFLILTFGCKRQTTTVAHIFERKELPDNRLQVKYRYTLNDTMYIDSCVVINQVLPLDSIRINIDNVYPPKSTPELPVENR